MIFSFLLKQILSKSNTKIFFCTYLIISAFLICGCKQKIHTKNKPVILTEKNDQIYSEAIEIEDTLNDDDDAIIETKSIEKALKPKPQPIQKKRKEKLSADLVTNYKTAQPKKRYKNPNRPILKFDKLEHNFGYIDEGEIIEHEFYFTNVGRTPAIISDASSSCGCTIPDYPKYPIAPGKRDKITVVFDSKGRLLKQNKSITITANTDPNYTTMYLTGEVWRTPKR